jgi:hydroxylamine reductase
MFYNYFQYDDYNSDSCNAKGVCSTDPTISSLQEVIMMYLKQLSFYTLKLKKRGVTNNVIKDNILNTISGLVSNTDYSQEQFKNIILTIYENLRQSKILYERICKDNNLSADKLENKLKFTKKLDLNEAIKQGEKEFIRKNKLLSQKQRNIYEIMFVLIKNVCINLIQLKSYNKECEDAYYAMIQVLSVMNYKISSVEKLKRIVERFVKINYRLTKDLHEAEIESFGEQEPAEVSFSTRVGKAILVSGSNLKELEDVLKATSGMNLDVYTHGSMIMGHTYPKLKAYKQLQGQFGLGVENCLLDFATFPGAILMTKNSLQNVEYLYRGRLFTTDATVPKGVTQIIKGNFKPLIKSSLDAKGFAKGQIRESLTIGYKKEVLEKRVNDVIAKINSRDIKHLFIIGILNHTSLQKRYFERLLKSLPRNTYAITLSTYVPSPNTFQINSSYDFMLMYKILEDLHQKLDVINFDISAFLTKCDKYSIANMLNLKDLGVKNILLGYCSPMQINPRITDAFKDIFGVKTITTPKEDLEILTKIA